MSSMVTAIKCSLSTSSMRGNNPLSRARNLELYALADELTTNWNPVRTFGSGAGNMSIPVAPKKVIQMGPPTVGNGPELVEGARLLIPEPRPRRPYDDWEILLYQFLEFIKDCYGVDMTQGPGQTIKDVYGRDVVERYTKIAEFYNAFKTRHTARRYP